MGALSIGLPDLQAWVSAFFLPFCRIAGVFALLPGIGGGEVPVRTRVALSAAITVLLLPTLPPPPVIDPLAGSGLLLVAREMIIGLATGLLVMIVFNAITLAGESIAITMGLGFALMNDPRNGTQVPTVSQFYLLLGTLLFFALDGHLAVLALLGNSFSLLPIGTPIGADAPWRLIEFAGVIFSGALAVALPALVAMLTVNLAMGVMTRAAPQLNLFSVGFPVTMLVGFVALLVTLPSFGVRSSALFDTALQAVASWLGAMP